MTYTHLTLFLFGAVGIIVHTLVELNKLNKASDGNLDYKKYFKLEKFSILISVFVVIAATYLSQEIQDLANAGKWIGLGIFSLGYLAQSVLIAFMGKAQSIITAKLGDDKQAG